MVRAGLTFETEMVPFALTAERRALGNDFIPNLNVIPERVSHDFWHSQTRRWNAGSAESPSLQTKPHFVPELFCIFRRELLALLSIKFL